MRYKQHLKSETNSTIYRRWVCANRGCPHCPAHRVENRGRVENGWKAHRATQWRG